VTFRHILLVSSLAVLPASGLAQATFKAVTRGSDIWLEQKNGAVALYDFRLGAGGAVVELRDNRRSNKRLLAPPFGDEKTDRVIQLVNWDTSRNLPGDQGQLDDRWNVNQAGTGDGVFHGTISVKIVSNTRVEVYSVGDLQWQLLLRSATGPAFDGRISMFTRYDMASNGVLTIRRVARMGPARLRSATGGTFQPVDWITPLHQNWLPFDAGSGTGLYNSVAFGFNGTTPSPVYTWTAGVGGNRETHDIPTSSTAAPDSAGFAAVFDNRPDAQGKKSFIAAIFGKQAASSAYTARWQIRARGFPFATYQVTALLPELATGVIPRGAIIDSTIKILPGNDFAGSAATIKNLADANPGPVIYAPTHAFTGELATIVSNLLANNNVAITPAMRTDHLASRLIP
jgi:hypothetical protein